MPQAATEPSTNVVPLRRPPPQFQMLRRTPDLAIVSAILETMSPKRRREVRAALHRLTKDHPDDPALSDAFTFVSGF